MSGSQIKDGIEKIVAPQNLTTAEKIETITNALYYFLKIKNERYGDSALCPINVFSKQPAGESLKIRIDDKLSRIKNNDELRKNDIVDLMGYLVFVCAKKKWFDFDDLID